MAQWTTWIACALKTFHLISIDWLCCVFLCDAQGGRRCTRPATTDTWRSPSGSSAPGRMSTLAAWKTKRRCMTQPGTDTSRFVRPLLHLICIAPLPRLFCAPTARSAPSLTLLLSLSLRICSADSGFLLSLGADSHHGLGLFFIRDPVARAGRWGGGVFLLNTREWNGLAELEPFLGISTTSVSLFYSGNNWSFCCSTRAINSMLFWSQRR